MKKPSERIAEITSNIIQEKNLRYEFTYNPEARSGVTFDAIIQYLDEQQSQKGEEKE